MAVRVGVRESPPAGRITHYFKYRRPIVVGRPFARPRRFRPHFSGGEFDRRCAAADHHFGDASGECSIVADGNSWQPAVGMDGAGSLLCAYARSGVFSVAD